MASILRMILLASYVLGLVSLVVGLVVRFIPVAMPLAGGPRGAFIFAGALFLCSVASHFTATAVASQ